MASKVENRATIIALSAELGIAPPENLEQIDKQVDLETIIADLEKKNAEKSGSGASTGAGAGGPPPPPSHAEPPPPKKVVATTYQVGLGKSVTTKRGQIGALEPVWPSDFRGGQADLDHWVDNGFVTKVDHFKQ
jgi:hypothetical protein